MTLGSLMKKKKNDADFLQILHSLEGYYPKFVFSKITL